MTQKTLEDQPWVPCNYPELEAGPYFCTRKLWNKNRMEKVEECQQELVKRSVFRANNLVDSAKE